MTELLDEWTWEAHYTDGSVLRQVDGAKFKDIEQDRLGAFLVVNEPRAPIVLQWRRGLKLIHFFYRVRHIFGSSHSSFRMTCLGWQDKGVKLILAIMPDGGVIITDDVDKIEVEL